MGNILKAIGRGLLRFLCAWILVMVTMMGLGTLGAKVLGAESPALMILVMIPVFPIFFACFAASNPKKVRAIGALKACVVTFVIALAWASMIDMPAMPEVADDFGPNSEMFIYMQESMKVQQIGLLLMYLAAALTILWIPSLNVRGASPVPGSLLNFEKLYLVAGLGFMAYSYLSYEKVMQGMVVNNAEVFNTPEMADALAMQTQIMEAAMPYSMSLGALAFVLLTLALTRLRLVLFRTLILVIAVFMVPGLLVNLIAVWNEPALFGLGVACFGLLLYSAWLLMQPPIKDWSNTAKQEFLSAQAG